MGTASLLFTYRCKHSLCMHRSLSKLVIGLQRPLEEEDEEAGITMERSMTTADLSDQSLGAEDAILIAAFLPKCQ